MTLPRLTTLLATIAIGVLYHEGAKADANSFEVHGSARVRAEFRNNSDYTDSGSDYSDFVGSRFRIDMLFKPNEKVNVFFQPQFSKNWGQSEYVPASATTNTETNTSGTVHDTGLDVHQAYFSYLVNEPLTVTMGRKELNYGDQLLVGGVGWNNIGRSFDLLIANYKYENGAVELFSSKVKDNNVAASGPGDKDFSGLYSSNKISDEIQNLDAYVFYLKDGAPNPVTSTIAYGFRAKSPISDFDYRLEVTGEHVSALNATDENQADGEVGYTFQHETASRVSAEYFYASKDFDQLFPTGHKWLGYADLFSRRNIKGFRLGVSSNFAENLSGSFNYHKFQRQDDGTPAYKFGGTAYGSAGKDADIASEYDLVMTYTVQKDFTVEGGACMVTPESYLKNNSGGDNATFYYLQVATNF